MTTASTELEGTLYQLPFDSKQLGVETAPLYEGLAAEHGSHNILVLKRFATGIDALTDAYMDRVEGVDRPTIVGLSAHANTTVSELDEPPQLLGQGERNLLLEQFLADRTWSDPYLAKAAEQESFDKDVGRFITEATWQGSRIETDDPALQELAATNDAFHEWLKTADQLDPARSLQIAAEALADDGLRERVQQSFDAVLALEFEEFTPIDRDYLAQLTQDIPLHCVAEANSAIQRTWNEPRPISAHTPGLEAATLPAPADEATPSAPRDVATHLATGGTETPSLPAEGAVEVIEADGFSDELSAIAETIERLHRTEGIAHDEMAVALRDSNAPIAETLQGLRAAGIPVASATVSGLEHDPAARELYALVSLCHRAAEPADGAEPDAADGGWEEDRALATLEARASDHIPDIPAALETVRERAGDHGLAAGIDHWIQESQLKHRVPTGESPLEAKTQFSHLRTLRDLASAIDQSGLLESTWEICCRGFEGEFSRATTDKIATELDLPDGGVLVDAMRVLKNEKRRVVFLVDLTDQEYPADPAFNSLFPTPHISELEGYPAFTTPSKADVTATFPTESESTRPLHDYYAALSRRMLAVGARCATERLYCCHHRQDATGTARRHQPSRFLAELEATFGEFDRVDHEGIYSHGEAIEFALTRLDESLAEIRRAGTVGDPVDLERVAAEFGAVQRLLEHEPPEDLAPALAARLDFAEGRVRRE